MVGDGRDINEEINVERRRLAEDGTDSIVRWRLFLTQDTLSCLFISIGLNNKLNMQCATRY